METFGIHKAHSAGLSMLKSDDLGLIMSIKNSDMPDMRGIEAFVAVMASGSMTAAAKRLGIGQPVITRLVRDLEAVLGFSLFERNGPRISPSPKGVQFYEDAQRLLTSYAQVAERAANLREERVQSLTLAATPAMSAGMVPQMLRALGADLPGTVALPTMDAEHLVQALLRGEADYAVSALPLAHAGLDCLAQAESHLVAVVAEDHAGEVVALDAFREARLLSVGNSYRIRHRIDAAFGDQGIVPIAKLTTNSSLNAMLAARAGLGIALVDPVSARGIGLQGIRILPLAVDIPYEWGLFRSTRPGLAELETALTAAFTDVAAALQG